MWAKKYKSTQSYGPFMESPVDKPFNFKFEEGMQDTPMIKPAMGWFGMPPWPVPRALGKGISRLHVDRDACKGSTDTPRGATFRTGTTSKLRNGFSQNPPDREK